MMKKMLTRVVLCLTLIAVGLSSLGCSQTANEERLGGQAHERHATGIDSQVADN